MAEEKDFLYMKEALKLARTAFDKDEVPIGAVIVHQNKIIARSHNQVELLKDATAHAEMLALSQAFAYQGDFRLEGMTLYSTLEPCAMCAGALFLARIKRLVWGSPDKRVGANGSWVDLFKAAHPIHRVEVEQGVLAEEASHLMRTFFQRKRRNGTGNLTVDGGVDRAAKEESACSCTQDHTLHHI